MTTLIDETPEAVEWANHQIAMHAASPAFGVFAAGVVWTDAPGPDWSPVGQIDPAFIEACMSAGMGMNRDHDPGLPVGKSLAARTFRTPAGRQFVAAVFGYYTEETQVRFAELRIDPEPAASSPAMLDAPPDDWRIEIANDPREVENEWLNEIADDAPLPVAREALSHNSEDTLIELIRVAIPYMLMVWNPFVTSIAEKAGESIYAGFSTWLRRTLERLKERKKPVLSLASHQNGCNVFFNFRGNEVGLHIRAHKQLPLAAAQAAHLIGNLQNNAIEPSELTYEYSSEHDRWIPSFLILADGRLVSDRNLLVAAESLQTGLSLALTVRDRVEQ
jgi:hypothetical protein